MRDLTIGTKVRIKSEEELKELFDREYNRLNDEWNKKAEDGTIVFMDAMLTYCGRECTISSNFTGLGYYMEEIGCYWNPDWFDVIEKPSIKVGDTIILKSLIDVVKDKEALNNMEMYKYTFGDMTCEEMWGKEYRVEYIEGNRIGIRKYTGALIYVPCAWMSSVVPAEEIYRRKIEDYVSKHNFNESLPDEDAPYDWTIEIDKGHRFIRAYVEVDEYTFVVFENQFESFIVKEVK